MESRRCFASRCWLTNSYTGRNFYYGIREHAMGSILNGIAYFGLHRCSGATFLVFADYMRAPIRVAALSELPVNYILTHDSIGVGEVIRLIFRRGGGGGRKALCVEFHTWRSVQYFPFSEEFDDYFTHPLSCFI